MMMTSDERAAALAQARALAESEPLSWEDLASRTGLPATTLRRAAARDKWRRLYVRPARGPVSRVALLERLWQAASMQVAEIESDMARRQVALADRERVSRTLATIVRTVQELMKIDHDDTSAADTGADAADDADIRRRLAERLARFGAQGAAPGLHGGDSE